MTLEEEIRRGKPVTLAQMLDARDRRAEQQRRLVGEHGCTLISYTLNMPGQYKTYPLARKAFQTGRSLIESQLCSNHIEIRAVAERESVCGDEALIAVEADGEWVKTLMMAIEQGHALGRLFDIDVIDSDGSAVKGAAVGRSERRCIVCGGPVWACARSRAHTAEQLALKTAEMIRDFYESRYADYLADVAVRALLYEVCITPKPGLVDRQGNGAHRDMDIFTFMSSSSALVSYFRDMARRSAAFDSDPTLLLSSLRFLGLQAEWSMFAATHGVNTHKGLIFSLGIICAAAGWLHGQGRAITEDALFHLCARIAGRTPQELVQADVSATYGQAAYRSYDLTGARGEAAAGFPAVRRYGLPVLRQMAGCGLSLNDAGVIALLHLLANVTDTNLVGRSDLQAVQELQGRVQAVLARQPEPSALLEYAAELDRELTGRYLSPGGCADLLAISIMLYFLLDQDVPGSHAVSSP